MIKNKRYNNRIPIIKGFTILEVLITIFIITSGFMILYTVFSMQIRHSLQSRSMISAEIIADSTIEEIKAHPYGEPIPKEWKEPVFTHAYIHGRKITTEYKKDFNFENKSFIGEEEGDSDKVTIEITWTDATGIEGSGVTRKYKEIFLVRREY